MRRPDTPSPPFPILHFNFLSFFVSFLSFCVFWLWFGEMMMGFVEEERARRWQEYVDALEEEKKKIHVFQRELPLCLDLVSRTIEIYRRQMVGEMVVPARSDCEEQTSSELPVLEEFIPIKRSSSDEQMEEDADEEEENNSRGGEDQKHQNEKKPDWLRSAQLWNPQPEPSTQPESKPKKPIVVEAKKATGAFLPFNKEKNTPAVEAPSAPPAVSSTTEATSGGDGDDKGGQSHRKPRRCWSPELHRRFLHALQQLGGSHAATPKQIRELMKVDGLTNDEVKSHLQKYRLHTSRRTPTSPTSNSRSPPPQQFILVGGIWVPPTQSDYTKAQSITTNKIYAPIASLPVRSQNDNNNNKDNNGTDEDRTHSISSATSASSLTITTSPRS